MKSFLIEIYTFLMKLSGSLSSKQSFYINKRKCSEIVHIWHLPESVQEVNVYTKTYLQLHCLSFECCHRPLSKCHPSSA